MKKENENMKSVIPVAAAILGIAVTAVFMALFAFIMYIAQIGSEYSPVLATVSLAAGTFAAAFYAARKIGKRGLLTGFVTGGITFVVLTLISLIVDKGGITYNTLFHFVIIMLSALIGGVMGVNKKTNRNYI